MNDESPAIKAIIAKLGEMQADYRRTIDDRDRLHAERQELLGAVKSLHEDMQAMQAVVEDMRSLVKGDDGQQPLLLRLYDLEQKAAEVPVLKSRVAALETEAKTTKAAVRGGWWLVGVMGAVAVGAATIAGVIASMF